MVAFVAEVSSNHNSDLERCLRFVDAATNIGCAAVKFQLFKIDELFAPEILAASEEHRSRKQWELPVTFLPEIARYCGIKNIKFMCTPFYLDAVDELYPYVDIYKIASYELLWDDLLIQCARTGKPVVLSTGMATLDEVVHAVEVLRNNGCNDLTVLHCVSGYPTPPAQCNLAAISTLKRKLNCNIGWSDHTVSPAVVYRAVHHFEANMVEFHLDLEGHGVEYQRGYNWVPDDIKAVIDNVNIGLSADGNGIKGPALAEHEERVWRADPSDGLRPFKTERERFCSVAYS